MKFQNVITDHQWHTVLQNIESLLPHHHTNVLNSSMIYFFKIYIIFYKYLISDNYEVLRLWMKMLIIRSLYMWLNNTGTHTHTLHTFVCQLIYLLLLFFFINSFSKWRQCCMSQWKVLIRFKSLLGKCLSTNYKHTHLLRSTVVTLKTTPFSHRIMKRRWENGQLPILSPSLPAWKRKKMC